MKTEDRKKIFIEALGQCEGNITRACELTGIDRKTVFRWRQKDPEFAERCDSIISMFAGAKALNKIARRTEDTIEPSEDLPFAPYTGRPVDELVTEEAEMLRMAMREMGTYNAALEPMIMTTARMGVHIVMALNDTGKYAYIQGEQTAAGIKMACNPGYSGISKMAEAHGRLLARLGLDFDPKRDLNSEDARDVMNRLRDDD